MTRTKMAKAPRYVVLILVGMTQTGCALTGAGMGSAPKLLPAVPQARGIWATPGSNHLATTAIPQAPMTEALLTQTLLQEAPQPNASQPKIAPELAMLQFGGGPGSVGSPHSKQGKGNPDELDPNPGSSSKASANGRANGSNVGEKTPNAGDKISIPNASLDLNAPMMDTSALATCMPDTSSSAAAKMSCAPKSNYFWRYIKNPLVAPLTVRDKFMLATRDTIDPFNLLTIVGTGTYAVETTPRGVYGPGLRGIMKFSGVNFTENMAGEYFGTFMVCSVAHQDPHYHREPNRSIAHRILHTFAQIAWTQGDNGRGMFNYANFVGGIATAAVSNTFVPGPKRQGWGNTATRLSLAFATSPSGNLITEFVPDIASHINLHVVIFQQVLNMISIQEGGAVTFQGSAGRHKKMSTR